MFVLSTEYPHGFEKKHLESIEAQNKEIIFNAVTKGAFD